MPSLVVDTDVASRIHRGSEPPELLQALVGSTLELSFVTVAELLVWAEARAWAGRRRAELESWIDARPVLPYSRAVAQRWAWLTVRARERGRARPTNDTWIAACCLAYDVPLATLDHRHFGDFADNDGLRLLPPRD